MLGIYKLIFPSGKVYIGKSKDIEERWKTHPQDARRNKSHLANAIRKYGWENIRKEVVEVLDNLAQLDEREIHWIAFFEATNPSKGYNLTAGGTGGDTFSAHSEEEKEAIRAKLRRPCPEEIRRHLSELGKARFAVQPHHNKGLVSWRKGLKTGRPSWNRGKTYKGKPLTEARKKAIGDRFRGVPKTDAHKEKLRQLNLGKVLSVATRTKMSNSKKGCVVETLQCPHCQKVGKSHAMFRWHFDNCKGPQEVLPRVDKRRIKGKKLSPETCQRMSEARRGKSQPQLQCPRCGKSGRGSAMHRWHFKNCSQEVADDKTSDCSQERSKL